MKKFIWIFFLLTACQFHPLYGGGGLDGVCVSDIPEADGYFLRQALLRQISDSQNCSYTLTVSAPSVVLSDLSISDNDFITMQRIHSETSYRLLDKNRQVVLSNSVSADGSSAVVSNPYSTVVSVDTTKQNLISVLADQIALDVAAFLDRNRP